MHKKTHQFPSLLLLCLLVPLLVDVDLEVVDELGVVRVRVEQRHQVVDVRRRQPQRLRFGKGNISYSGTSSTPVCLVTTTIDEKALS